MSTMIMVMGTPASPITKSLRRWNKVAGEEGGSQVRRSWVWMFRVCLLATIVVSLLLAPAQAAEPEEIDIIDPQSIITLPWDNAAQKPVPPAFVLPRQSRWGCLACHADHQLSRVRAGVEESLFIDPDVLGKSMHKKIACVDCHTNFTYEEHPAKNPEDYRRVAGLACMKCHPFQKFLYEKSIHGELALKGELGELDGEDVEPALCSDCHGSHNIQSPRFEPYRSRFRQSSQQVCGKCHVDRYSSYGDYYHGQAHKNQAKDAPTCWDCHSNHLILRGDHEDSDIANPANLRKTCGRCHDDPGESLVTYAPLIHGRQEALESNPIFKLLSLVIPERQSTEPTPEPLSATIDTEIITEAPQTSFFGRIIEFFFPQSLRPLGG